MRFRNRSKSIGLPAEEGHARTPFSKSRLSVVVALALAAIPLVVIGSVGAAGPVAPNLGVATSYAVLAGTEITNVPTTTMTGDLGLHPGTSVGGGIVVTGNREVTTPAASNAKIALTAAYDDVNARGGATLIVAGALGGRTLTAGLYSDDGAPASLSIASGQTLTLSGSADDVWIFQSASTLNAGTSSRVLLQGGAQACNVFWQVDSAATVEVGAQFVGTVMAHDDITLKTGATINGRMLAGAQANHMGALVMDQNTILRSDCATTPVVVTPPADTTPVVTTPAVTTPVAVASPSTAATVAKVVAARKAAAKAAAAKAAATTAAKKAAAKKAAAAEAAKIKAAASRRAATSTSTRGNARPAVRTPGFTG